MHRWLAWFLELSGSQSSSSKAYNFWSGFGGDIAIILSFLTAPVLLYRKHNCGVRWCWRIGRHDYTELPPALIRLRDKWAADGDNDDLLAFLKALSASSLSQLGGITHSLCRKHHPDHPGKPVTAAELLRKHHLYLGTQPGKG